MVATDYDYSTDRSSIIQRALRMVGGLHEGEVLSSYKEQNAITALNAMVKAWQNEAVFLWTEKVITTSTVAGTDNYTIPVDTNSSPLIAIDKAWIRQSGTDVPVSIKSWRDFQDLTDKTTRGFPSVLAVDIANNKMYLNLVPDAIYTLYTFGIVRLKDFEASAATGDFLQNWDRALVFGLAKELSFEYPVPGNEAARIDGEFSAAFLAAKRTEKRSNSDVTSTDSCYPSNRRG